MSSMGSHQSTNMKSDNWLTPPEIISALGKFDLDPCCATLMPWKTATTMISPPQDGLKSIWSLRERIWLNPPYSREAVKWIDKLATHGNGIALVFARTETSWFWNHIWEKADALLFLKGRIHFYLPDGTRAKANAGAPSVLVAYGKENALALDDSEIEGAFVSNWSWKL